jgi:hypothetical protein
MSATTAAIRGRHGGRAAKLLPGVAGVACTVRPSCQDTNVLAGQEPAYLAQMLLLML